MARKLGTNGPVVSSLGLGAMGMSEVYGHADRTESIATIHAALDAGLTLIDTGDFYGSGHNEMLIRDALRGRDRAGVLISVKFGALRDPAGGFGGFDGRPVSLKNSLAQTLKRLDTDYVDIYRPARLDPNVPIEETVGGIADMVKAGYVRYIGLSEVSAATIRKAHAVHPIVDLQIEYAIVTRSIEATILPTLRELGIGVTAYGVLSRGLISGHWSKDRAEKGDVRSATPRFQGENLNRNLALVDTLRTLAAKKDVTVAQHAIAWVLAQGDDIVPVVGARTRARLAESLGAIDVRLTESDLAEIAQAVPPTAIAGDRYPTHMMTSLDSETGALV